MIPLMVVIPFFFAFLILLLTVFDLKKEIYNGLFLLGIFLPWIVLYSYFGEAPVSEIVGGWEQISGIEVQFDNYNFLLIMGELALFSGIAVYLLKYFGKDKEDPNRDPVKSIYPIVLILHGGVLGTFVSRDLFNFFVYMEITSICSIILVACSKEKGSKIASYRYLMIYFLSSFFFILGMGLIYTKTGLLNLPMIAEFLGENPISTEIKIGMAMIFLALIAKAGIFPMYFLLPEAYSKADDPVTALISGMGGKVQIFGMLLILIFLPFDMISQQLKIVAFSSMAFGILIALFQNNIKKVIAYSSISQLGYILLAIALLESEGAIYHSFIHALSIGGIFLCIGILISAQKTKDLMKLSYRGRPLIMFTVIILSLSIIGVYPFLMSHTKQIISNALNGPLIYIFYSISVGTVMVYVRLNYHLLKKGAGSNDVSTQYLKIFPPIVFGIIMILSGFYFNIEFLYNDFLILGLGIGIFLLLEFFNIFQINIPEPFSNNRKGLAKEINYYTAVFVILNIIFLGYLL